ncbi:MAG: phenylalanine--tRNA ligase subunit beta [Pseudomonadota bacterium]
MRFTLSWLKQHLDTTATLDQIVTALTDCGLEVEDVQDQAALYAPFKVVSVINAAQHPNADRLRVCTLQTESGTAEVVCGAPNARAGIRAVYAPEGSYIPGHDFVLKKSVIRGVESNGMLVSEAEMRLPTTNDGIIEVPTDTPIGTPFATLYGLDDPIIDVSVTPNRPDCAGVRGIARDLAAKGLGTLKPLPPVTITATAPSTVNVTIATPDCPQFVGRVIRGVKNGPSPQWLQNLLKAAGAKPISALVDVTNYFCLGLSRPLHVFDADKISGNLSVRAANGTESLAALNGKTYTLPEGAVGVYDDMNILALGGIMGGEASGCDNGTTNVFLEVADFAASRIARTGRDLQIISDARYRFERGIDPTNLVEMADRATQMIIDLCGGTPDALVNAGHAPAATASLAYAPSDADSLLGIVIPAERQKQILTDLGFTVTEAPKNVWHVAIPGWRPDIAGPRDLIEEVIRIYGYHHLASVRLPSSTAVLFPPAENGKGRLRRLARLALAQSGMMECVTWSFMDGQHAALFQPVGDNQPITLSNPISNDLDTMRPSILPNLLHAARKNADNGMSSAALFEVGPVFQGTAPTQQPWMATAIRTARTGDRHWLPDAAPRPVDALDAKADAISVLAACGIPVERLQASRDAPPYYHPGRSGQLRLGANVLAYFGEIHPAVLRAMAVETQAVGCEIFLGSIPDSRKKNDTIPLLKVPALLPITRDFAFIVNQDVHADILLAAVTAADKEMIKDVSVFDVYQGVHVTAGQKSIAISVTLQPGDVSFTDADIAAISQKIVKTVADKTGASLRA